MPEEGNYYIFSPPYSKSEHFVKVTGLERNKTKEGEEIYVHFEHVLNNNMKDNYEQNYFESGSTLLNKHKVQNIVENIKEEIESLEKKREEFLKVLEKIREDQNSHNPKNTSSNGKLDDSETYQKKEIERVERN